MEFKIITTAEKGKGVLAGKSWKKGEPVVKLKGKPRDDDEIAGLSRYYFDHMIAIGKELSVVMESPEKYFNHSCDPNLYFFEREFFALRDIEEGEELTHDYSICCVPEKDEWHMKCKCESENCRKDVYGGFFKLPKKDQLRYFKVLDTWQKKAYRNRLKLLENSTES